MKLAGWGRYPVIQSKPLDTDPDTWFKQPFIAYGNGRSYGDAALADFHLPLSRHNYFLDFDQSTGVLTCETGVLLSEIIVCFLPRGWFLTITPGTKLITLGGAIASDVHGKNHHVDGCFSQSVLWFDLLLPTGEIVRCTQDANTDLFQATCGGMGLTGIILQAAIQLKPVRSQWIEQTTIKTTSLEETFAAFEDHAQAPYSVAWIDCLAQGKSLGRSILMLGDFAQDNDLNYQPKGNTTVPFDFPGFALNSLSVKIFNTLYYAKAKQGISQQRVGVDSFFYPLDALHNWNRIYGSKGFVQFQFILPKEVSFNGLQEILQRISQARKGSFLAVLKLYGPANDNWLSFPLEGYSLALDFKMQTGLVQFIQSLTDHVVELGGRVYLAKDALLTQKQLDQSYHKAEKFRTLRQELGLNQYFQSLLSQRLDL